MAEEKQKSVHFFDLPQEVRDMIYLYFRPFSWIDITQMPHRIHQPSISKVSKRVRKESLDVFYGKNRFMLDMRGWKHGAWPKCWTPNDIFNRWIAAIGDENAARLRHMSFYLQNFAIHYTCSSNPEKPRIVAKFRNTRYSTSSVDVSEDAPRGYTFKTAMRRAESRLRYLVDNMADEVKDRPLQAADIRRLCGMVESLKPALCTRMGVAWKGAVLPELSSEPIPGDRHMAACNECGYYRVSEANARYEQ